MEPMRQRTSLRKYKREKFPLVSSLAIVRYVSAGVRTFCDFAGAGAFCAAKAYDPKADGARAYPLDGLFTASLLADTTAEVFNRRVQHWAARRAILHQLLLATGKCDIILP
jgi:hypothetical protein